MARIRAEEAKKVKEASNVKGFVDRIENDLKGETRKGKLFNLSGKLIIFIAIEEVSSKDLYGSIFLV